jgi:YHS domain-containing protein
MNRLFKVFIAIAAALAISGCANRFYTPDSADSTLMLGGNDPVSYQTGAAPVKGDPTIKAMHDGGTYRFANAANRDTFTKSPARYAPQYGGYCSNGAPYSILMGGSADTYKVVNDRLFMFSGPQTKRYFEMDEAKNIQLADQYWESEMKGASSARFHSYYRIMFKVPHWKTGPQLEAELQSRQGKKN